MESRSLVPLRNRLGLSVFASLVVLLLVAGQISAATIGVLSPYPRELSRGAETEAAMKLDLAPHQPLVIFPIGEGKFKSYFNESGREVTLDEFAAVWIHDGDRTMLSPKIADAKSLKALKDYVSAGNGLLLTGTTLQLVHKLGAEPARPRIGPAGNDQGQAMLRPLVKDHPIFGGLTYSGGTVMMSDRGHPAYSDFHGTGGPAGGMLLAQTGAAENALVEYEIGKGRVIVMGWRLPHYSNTQNAHRGNLERITRNMLDYLSKPDTYQKVVVRQVANVRPGQQTHSSGVVAADEREKDWRAQSTLTRVESLRLAIEDLTETFGDRYPRGKEFLDRLEKIEAIEDGVDRGAAFDTLKKEALLANPLIDFDRMMMVRRSAGNLALPANWQSYSSTRTTGHDNRIDVLSPISPDGEVTTLYQSEGTRCLTDVDLDFDADRLMFSMPNEKNRWQLYEMEIDENGKAKSEPQVISTIDQSDVHNYDSCYLADGTIIFSSTAPFVGVPCVRGSSHVTNLYRLEPDRSSVRQLTVDQEHNWCPTAMNNGRVMYQRWEYTDTPHAFYRLMFYMNPDGTEQMALYGSNSYWPNAMFYSRPIPGSATKFVTVVGGHHDRPRMGELVVFDPSRGRHEADGVVQRIPGYGQEVEPIILDGLTRNRCPRFLHPYPLSDKYYLVSCQPSGRSLWGIYLVDVFDNMLLLREEAGYALMEPLPIRKTERPPLIPNRVDPSQKEATIVMSNVYVGEGIKGVPRGAVKKLRVISYNFSYQGMGGQVDRVGLDGPWDVRTIIGTVPVDEDGSAHFTVPAYVPLAVQPLDEDGKALQMMRSWFTCMPGEVLSCIGCHEDPNMTPPPMRASAAQRAPSKITPWYGPTRGFGFNREVQPVLDKYCIGCHDGKKEIEGKVAVDLTLRPDVNMNANAASYNNGAHFPPAYFELKRHVRGATIESDAHMLVPCDFHADQTKLVQMLRMGHYGVKLDPEAWDRIITWIDLNTPAHGTWNDVVGESRSLKQNDRRREMRLLYTGIDDDQEYIFMPENAPAVEVIVPEIPKRPTPLARTEITPEKAAEMQRQSLPADRTEPVETLDLGEGVTLSLRLIPAGETVIGRAAGLPNQSPEARTVIDRPFWMAEAEITNEQYARFDQTHDSRLEHGEFLQFSTRERGWSLSGEKQPVVRVSWDRAMAFCRWLSEKTGRRVTLPTEAQWEWAASAGSATSLWYGEESTDFSPFANLADATHLSRETLGWSLPSGAIPLWRPGVLDVDDKYRVSAPVGSFQANVWGLKDMVGNAAEWTRSAYRPYPYNDADGRNQTTGVVRRTVRGGSWQDPPQRATSSFRTGYQSYQPVIDVGFRVIVEVE